MVVLNGQHGEYIDDNLKPGLPSCPGEDFLFVGMFYGTDWGHCNSGPNSYFIMTHIQIAFTGM